MDTPVFIITKACIFKYIEKISAPKTENFQIKILMFFIYVQNIDCGYSLEWPLQGRSNEYPQSVFLSRNKKMNSPVNPNFTI